MGWVCMFECILDVILCDLKKYFCLVFRKINMSSYRILEIFQNSAKSFRYKKFICKYYLKNFISKNPIFL